jgi:pheromone shutdown protein TraB
MKKIIGVTHESNEELERVKNYLSKLSIKSVALEIPEDYSNRDPIEYFDDLISFLDGTKIIPLDKPELYEKHLIISLAKSIKESKTSYERMGKLMELFCRFHEIYPIVTKFLENSLQKLELLEREIIKEREKYMMKKIKEHEPDVVIVGNLHALNLKEVLPEYEYMSF